MDESMAERLYSLFLFNQTFPSQKSVSFSLTIRISIAGSLLFQLISSNNFGPKKTVNLNQVSIKEDIF